MEEIKGVLRKHDVAGIVHLTDPRHCEYFYHLETTWTCILTPREGIRFKSKSTDYPTKELQYEVVNNSIGTIASLHALSELAMGHMEQVIKMLGEHFDFTCRLTEEKREPVDDGPTGTEIQE